MKLVDRLADIKVIQRALRAELASIRQQLLRGDEALLGDTHVASIRHHVTVRQVAEPVRGNGAAQTPDIFFGGRPVL